MTNNRAGIGLGTRLGGDAGDAIRRFKGVTVLVAGDLILDRFINGAIERISPEAPVPVLHARSEWSALGGAGNVVANIVSLGGNALPVSVLGTDRAGRDVARMMEALGVQTSGLTEAQTRQTSCKSRFSALNQQVLRYDEEEVRALLPEERNGLLHAFTEALPYSDIVVLSDYGKGVLLDGVAGILIDRARAAGKRVVVDPKGADYSRYGGAHVITPNRKELGEAVGRAVFSDSEITEAGRELIDRFAIGTVLATRSERGMSVVSRDDADHIPTQAREVFDVSGAGDTVVATFALATASGFEPADAALFANAAAGVVVGKRGTAKVSGAELLAAMSHAEGGHNAHSVVDRETAQAIVRTWKAEGLRVGFTNGCFDILHAGHVSLLQKARAACDRLVLGLNSDASVKRLKGENRPVNSEADRAFVLAALQAVDLVTVFAEDTPLDLITALLPDLLVKGADYTVDTVVGARVVQEAGGQVMLIDLVKGKSTTATIKQLQASER